MKIKGRYIVLLLLLTMIIVIGSGCRKKVEDALPQTPRIENEIDEKQLADEGKGKNGEDNEGKENSDSKDQEAILITLEDQVGKEISVEQYSDKLLILTFWVDWNLESKEQLQVLQNIYPLMQDDVRFVGVHATGFDTLTKEAVKDKINKEKFSFPMLIDEGLEAQQKYYIGGFPTTVLIDYEGIIIHAFTRVIEEDELLKILEATLEKLLP